MYTKPLLASVLAGLVTAGPIEPRQFGFGGAGGIGGGTGSTETQFTDQGCADVLFAFARGSTEPGNMGAIVGPPTADALISEFGAENVRVEGIEYAAALAPNALPGGTDAASKESMQNTLTAMSSQCPDSVIVAGGYSQGAAVNHRAIEELPANVQNQIAGVILYGDTQNQQDNAQIPNFPADKVNIICADGDLVCAGSLTILPAHLSYGRNAEEGAAFLSQQIRGAQAARKAKRDLERNVVKRIMA